MGLIEKKQATPSGQSAKSNKHVWVSKFLVSCAPNTSNQINFAIGAHKYFSCFVSS